MHEDVESGLETVENTNCDIFEFYIWSLINDDTGSKT